MRDKTANYSGYKILKKKEENKTAKQLKTVQV